MRIDNDTFRIIRRVHQLTMLELAELLGYSQAYISRIEHGHEPVSQNVIDRLKIALSLDAEKLQEIKNVYNKFTIK